MRWRRSAGLGDTEARRGRTEDLPCARILKGTISKHPNEIARNLFSDALACQAHTDKKKTIGDNSGTISTKSSELETVQGELASDTQFLAELTDRCALKKKECAQLLGAEAMQGVG